MSIPFHLFAPVRKAIFYIYLTLFCWVWLPIWLVLVLVKTFQGLTKKRSEDQSEPSERVNVEDIRVDIEEARFSQQ